MNSGFCGKCGAGRGETDNFCRRCGSALAVDLPVLRSTRLPAVRRRSLPPSLVGSVAVLALGTGIEWVARRLAVQAAQAAGRALLRGSSPAAASPNRSIKGDGDVAIDEVLYIREVRLRR
jgi:hypothetical protein